MKYLVLISLLIATTACGDHGAQTAPSLVAKDASATCNPRADGFPQWSGYGSVQARCPNLNWLLAVFTSDTLPMTLQNQRLVSLSTQVTVVPGLTVSLTAPSIPSCVQADLYYGITPADVTSGRVLINPADSGKPNFYPAFSANTNIGSAACQPAPPCLVPETVHTDGIYQTGIGVEFRFTNSVQMMVFFAAYRPNAGALFPQTKIAQAWSTYPPGSHVVPWQILAIGQRRQVDDGCMAFPDAITDPASFYAVYPVNKLIDGWSN